MFHGSPLAVLGLALAIPPQEPAEPARHAALERVAVIATSAPGAEMVSVQASSRLLALTHSRDGLVELFDLARPGRPRSLRTVDLELADGEELTSVALPPEGDFFLAAIKAAEPRAPGRVVACSLAEGRRRAQLECGPGPDCVAIDPSGRYALVANEGEGFELEDGRPRSAPGSLTRIELAGLERSRVLQIALDEPSGLDDATGRFLERQVEGRTQRISFTSTAEFLEPEAIAFDPSGERAFVTLQEANAVALVDVGAGVVKAVFPLGTCEHPADLLEDGGFQETGILRGRREPDGIAVTPDGRFFVTADEGDTAPKTEETPEAVPAPGGRSVSVFDASTGALVGDTGPALDRAVAAAGLYPDKRSGEKGSEPEMVLALELRGRPHAAVTLERAGALALIDLSDPGKPAVVALAPVGDDPLDDAPEGLAHYRDPETGHDYLYSANEGTGTLGVLRVSP